MANRSSLRYSGYRSDFVTGGYALGKGYRAYLPGLMRFARPDGWSPFGRGGINGYAYCGGDPVNYSDPSGHLFEEDFLAFEPKKKPTVDRMGRPLMETPAAVLAPRPGFNEIEPDNLTFGGQASDGASIGTQRARRGTSAATQPAGHAMSVKEQLAAAFSPGPKDPGSTKAPGSFDIPSVEATPYHPVPRAPVGKVTVTVAADSEFPIDIDDATSDVDDATGNPPVARLINPYSTRGGSVAAPTQAPLSRLRQRMADLWETDVSNILFSPMEPPDPPLSRWPTLQGNRQ